MKYKLNQTTRGSYTTSQAVDSGSVQPEPFDCAQDRLRAAKSKAARSATTLLFDCAAAAATLRANGGSFSQAVRFCTNVLWSDLALALFVSVCWAGVVSAQPASLERPTKLRVTGTLLPLEEQERDDVVTVRIIVQDKPLLLRVGKVEELTRTERTEAVKWGVLLRQVRFYGPDPLIGRLRGPEMAGKVLTIEGELDTKARQFLVMSVEETTERERQHLEEK